MRRHRARTWTAAATIALLAPLSVPAAASADLLPPILPTPAPPAPPVTPTPEPPATPNGNGVESMSPQEALAAADAAMTAARDVQYTGTVTTSLTGVAKTYESVKLVSGKDCSEILTHDGVIEFGYVVKGRKSYLRASKGFWRSSGIPGWAARKLHQRWVVSKARKSERRACRTSEIVPTEHRETFVAQPLVRHVNGSPSIEYRGSDGSDPLTLNIATTGPAYLLRVHSAGADDEMAYVLRGVDTGTKVKRPKRARDVRGWLR